jgi:FkbM family methyltransferase
MNKLKSYIFLVFNKIGLKYTFYRVNFFLKKLNGAHSKDFHRLLKFYQPFIQKGHIVFDVGANIGNRAEVFLALGARVVCVEPNPELVKLLSFRFGQKVKIVSCGLGSANTVSEFQIASNNLVSSFSNKFAIHKTASSSTIAYQKKVQIKVSTLDTLIESFGKPDFCKIDTEGYELEVLSGLHQYAGMISFEFTYPDFHDETLECIRKLVAIGYTRFNYSFSETLSFEHETWITAEIIINKFVELYNSGKATYGDIYAR